MYYHQVETNVGVHGILWKQDKERVLVESISIPAVQMKVSKKRQEQSHPEIDVLANIISGMRKRRAIQRALRLCDFSGCTAWQQEIWSYLALNVPAGQVISYGGIAEKLGRPGAARSVGSCMAQNRFPLLIPCHRVVASGGQLGGFMKGRSDGLSIKRKLLAAEGVVYIGNALRNTEAFIS